MLQVKKKLKELKSISRIDFPVAFTCRQSTAHNRQSLFTIHEFQSSAYVCTFYNNSLKIVVLQQKNNNFFLEIRPEIGDPFPFSLCSYLISSLLAMNFHNVFFRFAPCVVSSCFHPLKFQIFIFCCCRVNVKCVHQKKIVEISQQNPTTEPYDE